MKPESNTERTTPPGIEEPAKEARPSRGTILVADDERAIRDVLRVVLESRGFEVVSTDNGIDALDLVRKYLPDLAILDILMPGITGLEVCRRMQDDAELKKTPIIVITSVTADSELPDGFWKMATNSEEFVTKPFDVFELADRAERVIRRAGRGTESR
jgi:CheY-like chemotaxis protein